MKFIHDLRLGEFLAESFLDKVVSATPNDAHDILTALDPNKKYRLRGFYFPDTDKSISIASIEHSVSQRLFDIRMHEFVNLSAQLPDDEGFAFVACPDYSERVFTNPGDDVLLGFVMNMEKFERVNLLFAEIDAGFDLNDDNTVTVDITPFIKGWFDEIHDSETKNKNYLGNLLCFDSYRIPVDYDKNGDSVRMCFNLVHLVANNSEDDPDAEKEYIDCLCLYYKYVTRTE